MEGSSISVFPDKDDAKKSHQKCIWLTESSNKWKSVKPPSITLQIDSNL